MMPDTRPAYWIAHVTITDEEDYSRYRELAACAVHTHGGRFLARGGRYTQLEGEEHSWHTVGVFPSYSAALSCYRSPMYQKALIFAERSSDRELVVVEGG